jgi:hypothetical protein
LFTPVCARCDDENGRRLESAARIGESICRIGAQNGREIVKSRPVNARSEIFSAALRTIARIGALRRDSR